MLMMLGLGGPDVRGPAADAHDAWSEGPRLMLMMLVLGAPDVRGPAADAHDAWSGRAWCERARG